MRYLLLLFFSTSIVCSSLQSQTLRNPVPRNYDINIQRLLVFATGNFVYGLSQGQVDKDSAMLFASKIFGLNRLLLYNEGYEINSKEAALINEGKIDQLKELVINKQGEDKIQLNALLGMYYLFKAGAWKHDLDSAKNYIQTARDLSIQSGNKKWKNETTKLLGICFFQAEDIQQSQQYFTAMVEDCRKNKDEYALAIALQNQAECLPFGMPLKITLLEEAESIFKKLNKQVKVYEALNDIIIEYFFTANKLTEEKLVEIFALEKKIGFVQHQYVHNTFAYIYLQRADFEKAMFHAEAAVKSMEATQDTVFSSIYCYRMGSMLYSAGRKKEGEYWNERAFNVPKTRENQPFWYASFLGKVNMLLYQNQPQAALSLIENIDARFPAATPVHAMNVILLKGGCNELLGQAEMAKKEYDLFLSLTEKIPPQFLMEDVMGALPNIGLFYFEQKDYANAKKILAKSLASQLDKLSIFNYQRLYLLRFKIDSLNGDYKAAIKNYQLYKKLADSSFNITQRQKLDELLLQYETEKKDQDIKMLKQQGELQQSKLKQSDITMKIAFAGAALLLIIVLLLYNQYRIKQKAGKETEIRNLALQKLVDEKEWLLKEVHHRVKNNLQTIVSLLESQSAYLNNDALLAIQDSQNRVYAMSLIHQKLYQGENVASINMSIYLPELVYYLRDSFDLKQQIQFKLQIAPVELDVSQAVPVALILNEAITNAIKYAFKGNKLNNIIAITMQQNGNHNIQLHISDNGIGLPENFDINKSSGLGLRLMKGLTEDIEGMFEIKKEHGTIISVVFKATEPLHKPGKISISELIGQPA